MAAPTTQTEPVVAPQPWVDTIPSASRWTLRLALEDALLVAEHFHDWKRERRYAEMLDRLEAPTI